MAVATCQRAWDDCQTERSIGMAVGPIPLSAIRVWCRDEMLDEDNTRFVKQVIRYVDNERAKDEAAKRPTGGK